MLDTVIGDKRNPSAANSLLERLGTVDLTGTLYIGYPILASIDQPVFVDALLTCKEHGVVVFDFPDLANLDQALAAVPARQDDLYIAVEQQLKRVRDLVVSRKLSVEIYPVSYFPNELTGEHVESAIATPGSLLDCLARFSPISCEQLKLVNAAIQRVATIRPTQKRPAVHREDSLGAKIQAIDRKIANLDQWQKSAAIEMPEGPQRIRGLAGSGKTIVLALKAAYLHARHPDWKIALTFQTRSLYQQLKNLVRRFSFEHLNDEPDWTKLQIVHSWGSSRRAGFYSMIADQAGSLARDFLYAKNAYGIDRAFEGVCSELLQDVLRDGIEPVFDAVLIDEAQDMPSSFFHLAFLATCDPKRIVWAYDELQNLSQYSMAPPAELFGQDSAGRPNIPTIENSPGQAKQDLILPVCYRNTPWALTSAHALGFGVYRSRGLVQFFDNPELWQDVGYEVVSGRLRLGEEVSLQRRPDAAPSYFREYLKPEEAVTWSVFENPEEQAAQVASMIQQNMVTDELQAGDILVIFTNPLKVQADAALLMAALRERGIASHIAGVTSSVDELFVEDSVAISGIYRAKGNEASMVYVLNSDYCFGGLGLIRRRNILFTAMTRSRAWVRVFGCGSSMQDLTEELARVQENKFKLTFTIPTRDELEHLRRIHRDRTPGDEERMKRTVTSLAEMLKQGDLANLPPELLDKLRAELK